MWWMLLVSFLGYCGKASAQVLPEYSAFNKTSIGLQLGTQGIGLQGTYAFGKVFNARVGFSTVPDITLQYNNRDLGLNRTSVYGIVDWQPLYGNTDWLARKWYLSAGISYYFNNTLYREGTRTTPDYYIYMSKLRPYVGTGLGNIRLGHDIGLRTDFGFFIPTSSATSTYSDKADKVSSGLRGLLPGMNAGITIYYKF
jgi:hypothetical protein